MKNTVPGKEWLHLIVFSGAVGAASYYIAKPYVDKCTGRKSDCEDNMVNLTIKKDSSKVVDVVDIESLGEKVSYCRCWRSKKVSSINITGTIFSNYPLKGYLMSN